MSNISFSDIEKQAIVSLLIEMINADRVITVEEMYVSNAINAELGISEEVFRAGMALSFDYATQVVKQMEPRRKWFVARLLVRIMDADGAAEAEHQLLEQICQLIELEQNQDS